MKPFNRASFISTLLECERLDLEAAHREFRAANDKRTALLAHLEERFTQVEKLIADDTINASAIAPASLFAKQIYEAVAAADQAYSKSPDQGTLPKDYTGSQLRNAIVTRALHAAK